MSFKCFSLAEETFCAPYKFSCLTGECIWQAWVCDGQNDCHSGEDESELICQNSTKCNPATEFRCEQSGQCVRYHQVCDGHVDCTGNSKACPHTELLTDITPFQMDPTRWVATGQMLTMLMSTRQINAKESSGVTLELAIQNLLFAMVTSTVLMGRMNPLIAITELIFPRLKISLS